MRHHESKELILFFFLYLPPPAVMTNTIKSCMSRLWPKTYCTSRCLFWRFRMCFRSIGCESIFSLSFTSFASSRFSHSLSSSPTTRPKKLRWSCGSSQSGYCSLTIGLRCLRRIRSAAPMSRIKSLFLAKSARSRWTTFKAISSESHWHEYQSTQSIPYNKSGLIFLSFFFCLQERTIIILSQ